ncbi:MAG: hypothetical protein GY952_15120 [Rhodobacteraceae bacterium]|nr:hypothetical protein [Paracoccaceae bacterium]
MTSALLSMSGAALAHAADQAFTLLLPTGVYTAVGVICVVATVVLVTVLPERWMTGFTATCLHRLPRVRGFSTVTSCLSAGLVLMLFVLGQIGPRDPLANLAPLFVWTLFWTVFVVATGIFGSLWHWLNPWSGPCRLIRALLDEPPRLKPANGLGCWPAALLFAAFAGFLLADPAPADPARLSGLMLTYWLVTLLGTVLFGPVWLRRCEFLYVTLFHFARLSPIRWTRAGLRLGWPGWQIAGSRRLPLSLAVVPLLVLAAGSFDGVNETFWWLDKIGINPLMFPGRSAVVVPTVLGLAGAIAILLTAFGLSLWIGLRLAGDSLSFADALALFAPTVLPIAFGYHIAHYLPGFLVEIQYTVAALSDPLSRGADILGLGEFFVTTGFFYNQTTVRVIWLTQGGAVVVGHVLAILLSHIVAIRVFERPGQAVISQIPISVFMVFYTLFGLWLLAAPRGG